MKKYTDYGMKVINAEKKQVEQFYARPGEKPKETFWETSKKVTMKGAKY